MTYLTNRVPTHKLAHKLVGLGCLLAGLLLGSMACRVPAAPPSPLDLTRSLPKVRLPGRWVPPADPAQRKQLDIVLRSRMTEYNKCVWKQLGSRVGAGGGAYTQPLIAQLGVDQTGTVQWLELVQAPPGHFALHECLSRELLQLEFSPPPAVPTLLVLTLPPMLLSEFPSSSLRL